MNENTIEIIEYQLKGNLPDPFTFDNGDAVSTAKDWSHRKKEKAGTKEKTLTMNMTVFKASAAKKCPTVITGDMCFNYGFDRAYIDAFVNNGINLVMW